MVELSGEANVFFEQGSGLNAFKSVLSAHRMPIMIPVEMSFVLPNKALTPAKRWFVFFLGLLLSGCVWFRLLEIKNQLADFDENMRIEVVDKHFIVHFKSPVLLSEDFIYLSKLNPTRIETLPDGSYRWYLDFHLDPAKTQDQKTKVVSFIMTYTREHKLEAFDFSPLFVEMAPVAFLEASIRSIGLGKIDQDKRQLKVDPEDLPKLVADLPKSADITKVMGPPELVLRENGLKVLVYHFKSDSKAIDPEFEERRIAEAKLFFDPAKDEMLGLKGRFAGLKLSIDYRKLSGR
jgi:hypothetical protein